MSRSAPIAITSLGVTSALGCGADRFAAGLGQHRDGAATPVDLAGGWHRRRGARLASLLTGPDSAWRPQGVAMRRFSRPSRFAVAAAFQAMAGRSGSGNGAEVDGAGLGVAMATMFGPSLFTQKIMDQTFDQGPSAVSPSLFTECVANAAAAQVSLTLKARGPNLTLVAREAGPAQAVLQAADVLHRGRATAMLAGISEEVTPFLHAQLDRFAALARASRHGPEAARPFDRRRNGVLAAEGAVLLRLEPAGAAGPAGPAPLALLRGGRLAFDATASPAGWGRGVEVLGNALAGLLRDHGISPGQIDLVVSGAGGSRRGDALEAGILRRVWGESPLPPVLAPKALTGEFGGGFLAAAVLAAAGRLPALPAVDFEVDPELGVTPLWDASVAPPHRTLVTVPASGGPYGWLLLERPGR